jgi:hypothetical protein
METILADVLMGFFVLVAVMLLIIAAIRDHD